MDNISLLIPEAKHYLLYYGTENPIHTGRYSVVKKFSGSPIKRALQVRKFAIEINAEIVHAHSSWGGFYSRIFRIPIPVVYEPHCFVFDDPHRHPLLRYVYRKVESILSKRTFVTVALTEHERSLATGIDQDAKVRVLPNIPTIPVVQSRRTPSGTSPVVSMIGRIAPQKGPTFFGELAQLSRERGLPFRFIWIGSGSSDAENSLTDAGVEVTGWLSSNEVTSALGRTWMYFHSAEYEGFPLSVLDAAAAKVPIIVRNLPCFDGTQLTKVSTPSAAIEALEKALKDLVFFESTKYGGEKLLETMNEEAHADVLRAIYADAKNESSHEFVGVLQ
ncbi:glycosyltransferase [Arthrobacter psychrochitiniphilus]|uniref:glycosyltransferase n=1 Tax=Arthrobacter psychrochitiniphilus TaxID=291045 RepID=UPI003F7B366A